MYGTNQRTHHYKLLPAVANLLDGLVVGNDVFLKVQSFAFNNDAKRTPPNVFRTATPDAWVAR